MEGHHELVAPPWRRVDGTLVATARQIREAYDREFASLGLKMPETSLLAFVAESEPMTQTELARRLDTRRAVTGARIDVLEQRGAVTRRPHPTDRRVWLIEITESGRQLVERINVVDGALRERLRAGISREDRHMLASILLRLQRNLADINGGGVTDDEQYGSPARSRHAG